VPTGKQPSYGDDDVIAVLGRHGADKVLLVTSPELSEPSLFQTHGVALAQVAEKIPPALFLCAATPGGRDLAPRLAARLGAAYVPEPSIEYGPRGELVMSRIVFGGAYRRRLAADDLERPVVASLTVGSYHKATGDEEAEVIAMPAPSPAPTPFEEVSREPDPAQALDRAAVIVTAGAGVPLELFPQVCELARRLGAEVAVTREALLAGLGSAEREIGIAGRTVSPRLYVALGASGASSHLNAVAPDAEIVAVNQDPQASIFRVASYGIVGDIRVVLPQLLAALGPLVEPPPSTSGEAPPKEIVRETTPAQGASS
jgi:electron transfer flavoprotein alpha subunit